MIKENQKLFNRLNVITDAVAAFAAVTLSYLLVFHVLEFEENFPLIDYIKLSIIFAPVQIITFGCMGLYDSFRTKTFVHEMGKLVRAFVVNGIMMVTMLYIIRLFNFSR